MAAIQQVGDGEKGTFWDTLKNFLLELFPNIFPLKRRPLELGLELEPKSGL